MADITTVAAFESMDDETAMKHLEHRHEAQLGGIRFRVEPGRTERRFRGGRYVWNLYHTRLHREAKRDHRPLDHEHEEE